MISSEAHFGTGEGGRASRKSSPRSPVSEGMWWKISLLPRAVFNTPLDQTSAVLTMHHAFNVIGCLSLKTGPQTRGHFHHFKDPRLLKLFLGVGKRAVEPISQYLIHARHSCRPSLGQAQGIVQVVEGRVEVASRLT